jgi:hypothetical protein
MFSTQPFFIPENYASGAVDSCRTATVSVSNVISQICSLVNVKDISVTGESIEETVVSLYKEFSI